MSQDRTTRTPAKEHLRRLAVDHDRPFEEAVKAARISSVSEGITSQSLPAQSSGRQEVEVVPFTTGLHPPIHWGFERVVGSEQGSDLKARGFTELADARQLLAFCEKYPGLMESFLREHGNPGQTGYYLSFIAGQPIGPKQDQNLFPRVTIGGGDRRLGAYAFRLTLTGGKSVCLAVRKVS